VPRPNEFKKDRGIDSVPRTAGGWLPGRFSSWHTGALPLALVVVVSLAPVLGSDPGHGAGRWIFAAVAVLTALALAARQPAAVRLGLAFTATLAAFALPWQVSWWPLPGVVGVTVYLLCPWPVRSRESPLRTLTWWLGRLTRVNLAAAAGLAATACATLWIYHQLTPAGFSFGAALLRDIPHWSLALAGLGFVLVNAAVEEILFRGVILAHLSRVVGTWPALSLQAAGFGLLNLHGYPYGPAGVALTAAYGLLLGVLRVRSGGLLAGWITHILADSVIFLFILHAATQAQWPAG
jgi:uncharacterized protein